MIARTIEHVSAEEVGKFGGVRRILFRTEAPVEAQCGSRVGGHVEGQRKGHHIEGGLQIRAAVRRAGGKAGSSHVVRNEGSRRSGRLIGETGAQHKIVAAVGREALKRTGIHHGLIGVAHERSSAAREQTARALGKHRCRRARSRGRRLGKARWSGGFDAAFLLRKRCAGGKSEHDGHRRDEGMYVDLLHPRFLECVEEM